MMIEGVLTIKKADLNTAVEEWLERHGILTTDRFNVSVKVTPGDRPFDAEQTEITVSGVVIKGKP